VQAQEIPSEDRTFKLDFVKTSEYGRYVKSLGVPVAVGRAFLYGVAAIGRQGGVRTASILMDELQNVMTQMGCRSIAELRDVE